MFGPSWGNTGNFFFKPPRPLAIALPNRHGGRRYAFPPYAAGKIIIGQDFKPGAAFLLQL